MAPEGGAKFGARDNLGRAAGVMNVVGSGSSSRDGSPRRPEFDAFALRVSPSLLRSAYVLTGDRGHAEDLLQMTLLRTAQRWDAASESPDAYAHRVLVNLSRDRRRSLRRRPVEQPQPDDRVDVADDPLASLLERDAVTRAVRSLPTRQREVVVLRFLLDLSITQTAVVLGASEGTVKSHTARALDRMRELLADADMNPEHASTEVHHHAD
jgi:RNA polymerase sigma-70 factor (sigma-E family)